MHTAQTYTPHRHAWNFLSQMPIMFDDLSISPIHVSLKLGYIFVPDLSLASRTFPANEWNQYSINLYYKILVTAKDPLSPLACSMCLDSIQERSSLRAGGLQPLWAAIPQHCRAWEPRHSRGVGIGISPQVCVLATVPFWGSSGWPHRSGQAAVCADAANRETGVGVDRISYSENLLTGYLPNSSSDEILFEWHKYISCYLIGKWIVYLYF